MTSSKTKEYSDMCEKMNFNDISLSFSIVERGIGIKPNSFETYSVNISNDPKFKEKLTKNIINYINKFKNKKCLAYDPLKYEEDTFEYLEGELISEFYDFKKSFGNNPIANYKDKIIDFNFYVLGIKDNLENDIYIIRKMNGYKKINSKGVFAWVSGNELKNIEENVIGIDDIVDLIIYNGLIFILNHHSIKKLFNLKGAFQKQVSKILKPVKKNKIIDDYDKFERNIRSNERLINRLISVKRKGAKFDKPLDNPKEVQQTIKDFGLNISYKNNQIIFDESLDKEAVLNLILDFYYKTTQNQTKVIID
jgi:hypothetical protein|nr:MAG TPA: protein of unknown function (DUF4868) [Caudoviricetes sp.]